MSDKKEQALENALNQITKRYGDGSIMRLGEAHTMQTDVIPTGSLSLDLALGVGGIPPWAGDRNLRARIIGENHHLPACGGRSAKIGRHSRFRRHGTRA